MLLWVAARAEGAQFFSAISWFKWDSLLYSDIAQKGYYLHRCTPAEYTGPLPPWCGDTAWFPGYPAVLAVLDGLGLPPVGMAVLVSWVFDLAVLLLLWNGFLRRAPAWLAYLALAFAACCPGGLYMHAAFPMSMTVFFILLWLLALRDRRWVWAGLAGGCAAFCYPTAVVLVPLAVVWIWVEDGGSLMRRCIAITESGGLTGLGILVALAVGAIGSGRLNAFPLAQSHYEHGFHEPFSILWPLIHGALSGASGVPWAQGVEALLAAFMVVMLAIGLIGLALRGRLTRWDVFLMAFIVVFWLFPATQANESYWRGDTLLLPAALLMLRVRAELSVLICAASIAVFPFLAYYFFAGGLI